MDLQNMGGFGIKDCLTEASLGLKFFRNYNKIREIYTFSDKCVGNFMRKLPKLGRVAALSRYFESNHCEEILNTIRKYLKIYDNEISIIGDEYLKYY